MKSTLVFLLLMVFSTQAQEDVIRAALQAQLDAPQLRSTLTQDIEGEASDTIIEYVAPDSFRMVMPDMEMIVLSGKTYQKESDVWQLLDMDMSAMIMQARQGILEDFSLSDIQALPNETLDSKPCAVYSYTTTWGDFVSQDKIWIEKATGLPLQNYSEGNILGSFTKSTNRFEYDPNLTITAPIQ